MSTHRSLVAGFALLIAAVLPTASKAEVVAETDAFGNYIRTSVMTQSLVRQVRVWRPMRRHGIWGAYLLNPDGDRFGDQYPTAGRPRILVRRGADVQRQRHR
jgi:hypothetical protein